MDYLQDKNPTDNEGTTPLHIAASEGNLELCRITINNVNDKNPADNEGHKSLHQALYNTSQLQICQLKLKLSVIKLQLMRMELHLYILLPSMDYLKHANS